MSDLEQWADRFRELIQTLDRLPTLARELASVPGDGTIADRRRILDSLVNDLGLRDVGLGRQPFASSTATASLHERLRSAAQRAERSLPDAVSALAGAMTSLCQPAAIPLAGVRLRWFMTTDDNPKQYAAVTVADAPDSLRRAVASLEPYRLGDVPVIVVAQARHDSELQRWIIPDFVSVIEVRNLTHRFSAPQRSAEEARQHQEIQEQALRAWNHQNSSAGREVELRRRVHELETAIQTSKG